MCRSGGANRFTRSQGSSRGGGGAPRKRWTKCGRGEKGSSLLRFERRREMRRHSQDLKGDRMEWQFVELLLFLTMSRFCVRENETVSGLKAVRNASSCLKNRNTALGRLVRKKHASHVSWRKNKRMNFFIGTRRKVSKEGMQVPRRGGHLSEYACEGEGGLTHEGSQRGPAVSGLRSKRKIGRNGRTRR